MSAEVNPLTGTIVNITNQVINKISCISKEGSNIGALPLSLGVPIIRCISDGDGKKQNRFYGLRSDNNGYDPIFPAHTHSPDDPVNDGGSMYDALALNGKYNLWFLNQSALKAFYYNRIQGTSTIADDLQAGTLNIVVTSKYNVGGSIGYSATLIRGGLRLHFGNPFVLRLKQAISDNTSLVYRGGINMPYTESVQAPSNQVGIEGCTSQSVNYQASSGNSSGRSGLAMAGSDMQQASSKGYKLAYYPSDKVIFQDGLGNEIVKITDMPAVNTGSDSDSTLRIGICTSVNADRILKIWSSELLARIYDTVVAAGSWL